MPDLQMRRALTRNKYVAKGLAKSTGRPVALAPELRLAFPHLHRLTSSGIPRPPRRIFMG